MARSLTDKDLAYDRIADQWSDLVNKYDTRRRVEVLIDEFLGPDLVRGKSCLDAGCGLGEFTSRLRTYNPSRPVSCDIAPNLVDSIGKRFPEVRATVADLLDLESALSNERFDVVVSSEVIEHTPDPRKAVQQLARAVAPGGVLALSVPNRRWIWLLRLAEALRLRPHYAGYENWVPPQSLTAWLAENGLTVLRAEGVHTVPWQLLPKRLLRDVDMRIRDWNYPVALNLAILARRV
jgi:2-polyprenyl-6-hydroxyphenyl methylase/3-demethylubiquinone-9 3-methyltransferase